MKIAVEMVVHRYHGVACVWFLGTVALLGCGGRASSTESRVEKLPESCEAYLSKYEGALSAMAPESIARARAMKTRESLQARLSSSHDEADRRGVQELCTAQLKLWTVQKAGT